MKKLKLTLIILILISQVFYVKYVLIPQFKRMKGGPSPHQKWSQATYTNSWAKALSVTDTESAPNYAQLTNRPDGTRAILVYVLVTNDGGWHFWSNSFIIEVMPRFIRLREDKTQ